MFLLWCCFIIAIAMYCYRRDKQIPKGNAIMEFGHFELQRNDAHLGVIIQTAVKGSGINTDPLKKELLELMSNNQNNLDRVYLDNLPRLLNTSPELTWLCNVVGEEVKGKSRSVIYWLCIMNANI